MDPQATTHPAGGVNGASPQTENKSIAASYISRRFVMAYYKSLHDKPDQVHCFYNDDSEFARIEVGQNFSEDLNICGQLKVYHKIRELGFEKCKVRIKTIDSQYSFDGSVLVMVTGLMSNRGEEAKQFMQTFLLARQKWVQSEPVGQFHYYVRNDILRFMDSSVVMSPLQSPTSTLRKSRVPAPLEAQPELKEKLEDRLEELEEPKPVVEKEPEEVPVAEEPKKEEEVVELKAVEPEVPKEEVKEKVDTPIAEPKEVHENVPAAARTWCQRLFGGQAAPAAATAPVEEEAPVAVVPVRKPRAVKAAGHVKAEGGKKKETKPQAKPAGKAENEFKTVKRARRERGGERERPEEVLNDLFVSGLPDEPAKFEDEIRKVFGVFGEVKAVVFPSVNKNFCFVQYKAEAPVLKALSSGVVTVGEKRVRVERRRLLPPRKPGGRGGRPMRGGRGGGRGGPMRGRRGRGRRGT